MPNGFELTPEAIENYIAASQALTPPVEPLAAPPSMQFVTGRTEGRPTAEAPVVPPSVPPPPVPLLMGPRATFTATAAPPAINPLETMRKRINEIDFKTKQDAIQAAVQFEALRAYHRDVAEGKDATRWLPTIFSKNPSAAGSFARATAMPSVYQGSNLPPAIVMGGRPYWPPASAIPKPPLSTNVTEFRVPGSTNVLGYGVESGPQTRRFVPVGKSGPSDSVRVGVFNKQIGEAEREIERLDSATRSKDKAVADAANKETEAWRAKWKKAIEQRDAIGAGSAAEPAAQTVAKRLTPELARDFLKQAGGDRVKARQLAKDAGYEF